MRRNDPGGNQRFDLFTRKGSPLVFHIPPGATKRKLKSVIEQYGGEVTSRRLTDAICLADEKLWSSKSTIPANSDCYWPTYILDCVKHKDLLEMEQYRCSRGTRLMRKIPSADVVDEDTGFDDDDDDDDMAPANVIIRIPAKIKGRSHYTKAEDLNIMKYLMNNGEYGKAKGIAIWRTMEKLQITPHTAQSMFTRYRKVILKQLDSYSIPDRWKSCLSGDLNRYAAVRTSKPGEDDTTAALDQISEDKTDPQPSTSKTNQSENQPSEEDPEADSPVVIEEVDSFDEDLIEMITVSAGGESDEAERTHADEEPAESNPVTSIPPKKIHPQKTSKNVNSEKRSNNGEDLVLPQTIVKRNVRSGQNSQTAESDESDSPGRSNTSMQSVHRKRHKNSKNSVQAASPQKLSSLKTKTSSLSPGKKPSPGRKSRQSPRSRSPDERIAPESPQPSTSRNTQTKKSTPTKRKISPTTASPVDSLHKRFRSELFRQLNNREPSAEKLARRSPRHAARTVNRSGNAVKPMTRFVSEEPSSPQSNNTKQAASRKQGLIRSTPGKDQTKSPQQKAVRKPGKDQTKSPQQKAVRKPAGVKHKSPRSQRSQDTDDSEPDSSAVRNVSEEEQAAEDSIESTHSIHSDEEFSQRTDSVSDSARLGQVQDFICGSQEEGVRQRDRREERRRKQKKLTAVKLMRVLSKEFGLTVREAGILLFRNSGDMDATRHWIMLGQTLPGHYYWTPEEDNILLNHEPDHPAWQKLEKQYGLTPVLRRIQWLE